MTSATQRTPAARLLDPIDRNSEVLFGLFMVLTFTGTLSVATAGREDVRLMLVAAIGCNAAWGFVDGVMYVLRNLVARGRKGRLARELRAARSPTQAHGLIAAHLGPIAGGLGSGELEGLRTWLLAQPVQTARVGIDDLRGALVVFALVFGSTFPVVLPFIFMSDLQAAMRVSAAIAIGMMFLCGYGWGRYADMRPLRTGLVMVLLGVTVELVVIALGG